MTSELAIVKKDTAFRKLTVEELNDLGYELTGRQITLGGKPTKYAILEVKNEGVNDMPVGFCYIFSIEQQSGMILDHNFNYYIKNPEKLFCQ